MESIFEVRISGWLKNISHKEIYPNTEKMKIKALIGINGYCLMVCHCSGKLYYFSIIDQDNVVHNFEGIYSNLCNAIDRGKSVIQTLHYSKSI